MSRTVFLTGPAKRDLKNLDRELADRIIQSIEQFADAGQGDVRRLSGPLAGFLRLRVGKDWRVVFRLQSDDSIEITRIGHRSEVYRVREEVVFHYEVEARAQ